MSCRRTQRPLSVVNPRAVKSGAPGRCARFSRTSPGSSGTGGQSPNLSDLSIGQVALRGGVDLGHLVTIHPAAARAPQRGHGHQVTRSLMSALVDRWDRPRALTQPGDGQEGESLPYGTAKPDVRPDGEQRP
jgi:hypothetical protein